jgi:hypothetical protein
MQFRRTLAMGLGLSLVAPLALVGPVGAESPQALAVVKAERWLGDQQQADGGFELAGFPGFETPDAVLAIASAGANLETPVWSASAALAAVSTANAEGKNALDALDDLVDGEADPTSNGAGARAAKLISLVVAPLGLDAADFDPSDDSAEPVDLRARMDVHRNGDGSYDFGPLFNGLLYSAIALDLLGEDVPQALIDQILAAQRDDGSWDFTGTTTGGGDDIDTTAIALLALRGAGLTVADSPVADAVAFLAARQQPSGAWQAFGSDDPNSTAVASIALSALQIDLATAAWRTDAGAPARPSYTSPSAWLLSQQQADGRIASPNDSWGITTFATSQATQALGQQWFLADERAGLVDRMSQTLASPAAAPATGRPVAAAALGTNSSVRSGRVAAGLFTVTGQAGREAAVADLFQAAFGRPVDPSGRAFWSRQLITLSRPEVLARLTGSSEYYRRAGGTIPAFVDAVYQSVLGRAPDPSGRSFWIRQIQGGRSVQAVARSLTASSEYRRKSVVAAYQRQIDRAPTVAERDEWTARVATVRIEWLIAGLAGSAEYYALAAQP